MKRSYEERVFDEVSARGYIIISKIDPFMHKKRNTLNKFAVEGKLQIYYVSPSYDGYRII